MTWQRSIGGIIEIYAVPCEPETGGVHDMNGGRTGGGGRGREVSWEEWRAAKIAQLQSDLARENS